MHSAHRLLLPARRFALMSVDATALEHLTDDSGSRVEAVIVVAAADQPGQSHLTVLDRLGLYQSGRSPAGRR